MTSGNAHELHVLASRMIGMIGVPFSVRAKRAVLEGSTAVSLRVQVGDFFILRTM